MAKTKGKGQEFTQLGARVPKDLADKLKGHARELGMTYTNVMLLALRGYMGSSESRLAVVEARLRRTERELRSLRSHLGLPNEGDNKASTSDGLAELMALERPE